jgi:type IV pilus assembly protein PilC
MKPIRIVGGRGAARRRNLTLKDLAQFTYQFSVLMEARIPVVEGLRSIVEQEPKERLREIVEDVATQIEGGSSLTEALSPHREVFGETYVETVRTAERSGNMIDVLARLAGMLDQQYEMRKNVKGAMMYPVCVIGALVLAVLFLMTFVVPRFAEMFASRGIDLPLPTQFVIAVSGLLRSYWYLFLGGAIGGIWGLRRAWRDPAARQRIDTFLHHVPFMRDILKGLALSRFTNVVGISLRSGLSLIEALEMAGRASGRPLLQRDAEKMREQVNLGGRLSDAIGTCQYVPAFARRMIAAGEEAGELPRMCEIVARNYDREVVHLTRNVTTVIEPIMIVGLAAIVLLIALAIFLPMWNMAALIG